MGSGAAPAGGARNPAPGRSRVAVRAHYGALPSMAGRGFGEGRRKPAGGRCLYKEARSLTGRRKHGPANGNRRVARRKAPSIANDARTKDTVAPPGAPLPERIGEAKGKPA